QSDNCKHLQRDAGEMEEYREALNQGLSGRSNCDAGGGVCNQRDHQRPAQDFPIDREERPSDYVAAPAVAACQDHRVSHFPEDLSRLFFIERPAQGGFALFDLGEKAVPQLLDNVVTLLAGKRRLNCLQITFNQFHIRLHVTSRLRRSEACPMIHRWHSTPRSTASAPICLLWTADRTVCCACLLRAIR